MAAPRNNQNALGNSGGREWGKKNRNKAAKVKGLTLDYIIKAFKGKDEELKKQIVLRIATTCFPIEHVGPDGEAIQAQIVILPARNEKKDNLETK